MKCKRRDGRRSTSTERTGLEITSTSTGRRKGQPVEPCGDGCPDLERGDRKPSGDLYFILEKFPHIRCYLPVAYEQLPFDSESIEWLDADSAV